MKTKLQRSSNGILIAVIAVSLAANVALFLYLSTSKTVVMYRDVHAKPDATPSQPVSQDDGIVERVRKLMDLPDETPTVATVTSPEKLRDQPFFQKAKVGDKVLIYSTGKKAILYDPIADKVLNVAPLNLNSATSTRT